MHKNQTESEANPVIVHADGCRKKNGEGGWASTLSMPSGRIVLLYGYSPKTTNNIMELSGPVMALDYLNHHGVKKVSVIVSDSRYFVDGFNQWMISWHRNGWHRKGDKSVKNLDIWKILFDQKQIFYRVKAKWVKGHSINELNNACDLMSNFAVITKSNNIISFDSHNEFRKYLKEIKSTVNI